MMHFSPPSSIFSAGFQSIQCSAAELTKLQPAYVEDVAEAIATALQRTDTQAITFECGGPRFYTYEELLRTVARGAGLKPRLIPVPFAAWHVLPGPRKYSRGRP